MYDDYESDGFNDEWSDEYDYFNEPQEYNENFETTFSERYCGEYEKYSGMSIEEILKLNMPIEEKCQVYLARKYGEFVPGKIIRRGNGESYEITVKRGVYDCPTMFESKFSLSDIESCINTTLRKRGKLEINDIKNIRKLNTQVFIDLYNKLCEKFGSLNDSKISCDLKSNTVRFFLHDVLYVSDCDNIKALISSSKYVAGLTEIRILNINDINVIYNIDDSLELVRKVNLEDTDLKKAIEIFKNLDPTGCEQNDSEEYEISCKKRIDDINKYSNSFNIKEFYSSWDGVYIYTVSKDSLFRLYKCPPIISER